MMNQECKKILWTMQVFLESRKNLIDLTIKQDPTLFNGLHSSGDRKVFELYLQQFELKWILRHFYDFQGLLQEKSLPDNQRKIVLQYFSQIYLEFVKKYKSNFKGNEIGVKLLEEEVELLDELITFSDKAEENLKKIMVLQKKANERFEKRIEECKKLK